MKLTNITINLFAIIWLGVAIWAIATDRVSFWIVALIILSQGEINVKLNKGG